jgi:class 3 adenylate cyclase
LTAEDLNELGVTALGHRRKLLDAIAALWVEAGNKAPMLTPAPTREAVGERRHITVMFCDLVGSTQHLCRA